MPLRSSVEIIYNDFIADNLELNKLKNEIQDADAKLLNKSEVKIQECYQKLLNILKEKADDPVSFTPAKQLTAQVLNDQFTSEISFYKKISDKIKGK